MVSGLGFRVQGLGFRDFSLFLHSFVHPKTHRARPCKHSPELPKLIKLFRDREECLLRPVPWFSPFLGMKCFVTAALRAAALLSKTKPANTLMFFYCRETVPQGPDKKVTVTHKAGTPSSISTQRVRSGYAIYTPATKISYPGPRPP